jgi:ABC-type antimicrobial peptide transport system permease subunit
VLFLLDEHRPSRRMVLLLRAQAPAALAPALRAAIRDVDADLPLYQLRTASDGFEDENSSNRLLVGMFAAFAGVAVLLATTGLYGVMSYAVSQRTPEIAVRMALGAPDSAIAASVVGRSMALAALGTVLGMGGALALSQAMTAVLFGVTATDPATYSSAAALALAAAVIAAWLPMRRAAGIDPIQSLKGV